MPDRRSRSSTAGTGEVRQAQVFVAAMGASSYTYAEATWTQTLPDWIGSHTRALTFFGGVPAQLVPDNPRVGVDRANWYEPGLNRTYLDLATHYSTSILPVRVRRPRDKAKVEVAVLVVERWILARLRHRRFFFAGRAQRGDGTAGHRRPEQRRDMLEIVEERYGRGATLITSQLPVDRWHDLIGDPTLGDAILDRVIHNAHRLQLSGESLRKKVVQAAPA
jgi:transposase